MSSNKINFPDITIESKASENILTSLTLCLADLYTLSALAQDAHWNIEGINFSELHEFFGEQYDTLTGFVDDVAERIRQLNYYVKVDLAGFQYQSGFTLPEAPQSPDTWLTSLYTSYQKTFNDLKSLENISGAANNLEVQNLAITINESLMKTMWMIRSLKKK